MVVYFWPVIVIEWSQSQRSA